MTKQGGRIETLMLIDDSKIDQKLYRRIVERSGKVGTILSYYMAHEALEALMAPDGPRPDLILLDINMPRMNGFGFLEAVRSNLGEEFCPVVVMLTTSLEPSDEDRARQFSCVRDFLNKPLTRDHIEKLVDLI